MTGDERETLRVLGRPANLPVLAERLGLSGDTNEVMALCQSLDGLSLLGLIEYDPTPGFMTIRWRRTDKGRRIAEAEAAS